MTETDAAEAPERAQPGLATRFFGVIFSPKETFAAVVARPRWVGMIVVVTVVSAICVGWFLSTEVGQLAYLDAGEASGRIQPDQREAFERMLPYMGYISAAAVVCTIPLMSVLVAGILFAVFNAAMGGEASFKQVFAVEAHSGTVLVVQQLFITPLNYARESMSSPTNLAVFLPMLEEGSFLARLLGIIDLFYIWWLVVLAIGLGVLYRRRTQPIALTLLAVYAVIAIVVAAVMSGLGRS